MASVRQFPTIKAVRSFVIGGVGSGTVAYPPRQKGSVLICDDGFQVEITTMSRAVTGMSQ